MSDTDLPRRLVRYASTDPADKGWSEAEIEDAMPDMGLEIRRIALTVADTEALGADLGFPASDKARDPRYGWFVDQYGGRCWELDAMNPKRGGKGQTMETFVDEFGILRRVGSNKGARPAPTRPIVPARPAASRPVAPARPVGYRSGEPHKLCGICLQPAHFSPGTLLCESCAGVVRWRVALARSGLRVVA